MAMQVDSLSPVEKRALIAAARRKARSTPTMRGFLPELLTAIGALIGYWTTALLIAPRHDNISASGLLRSGIWTFIVAVIGGLICGWVGSCVQRRLLRPDVNEILKEVAKKTKCDKT